jgi:hypothetical protein
MLDADSIMSSSARQRRGSGQDPNMTTHEQIAHELRVNLNRLITILRPYAQSSGPFHSCADLETAISLAQFYLARAGRVADKLKRTPLSLSEISDSDRPMV